MPLSFRLLRGAVSSLVLSLAGATAARAQNSTITHDFETAGQWTGNFRSISGAPTGTVAQTTSGGNGILRYDITGGNQATAYLFDQTPTDTTASTQSTIAVTGPISVSFRARTNASNSSFSVVFADPSNLANNVTGIVNILTGADQVRFFKDGTPATAGAGIGTQVGSTSAPSVVEPDGSTFTTVTVTLTTSGTTPTLVVNWGGVNYTSTFAAGDYDFANGKTVVILRLFDASTSASAVDIDDIVVTSPAAPENPPAPPEPNVAPVLPSQSNRTATPYQLLTIVNTATDSNTPAQTLSYQLLNPPAGASINSSGVITWVPTADQANTVFTITTRVTDSGSPALSAENSFTVSVGAFSGYNQTIDFTASGQFSANFRALTPFSGGSVSQTTADGTGLVRFDANTTNTSPAVSAAVYAYDATPGDTTLATQTTFDTSSPLTVSADVRAVTTDSNVAIIFADPENSSNNISAVFNLRTGNDTIRFFKDGTRGSTSFSLGTQVGSTTTVATNAEPGASAAFTNFSVTLNRDGARPTLTVTVAGANPVSYTYYFGNMNWGHTTVLFRVDDAGATTGSTPVDLDNINFVSDNAPASPVAANTAPLLLPVSNRSVAAGRLLVVANPADDLDAPRQTLSYQLTQAPAGATIDAEGNISWRPAAGDVSATPYTFTTVVTDSGSPALTATNTFTVTVAPAVSLGAFTQDLDFLTTGQFDACFRSITDVGGGARGQVGGMVVLDAISNGGNQSQAWLFDTTPADTSAATQTTFPTGSPVTVRYYARVRAHDSSIGVMFADSRNAQNNVGAFLNLRNDSDVLRFYRDGALTQRSSSAGTQVGSDNTLVTAGEPLYPEYLPVTVTLSVSGTTPTISVQIGDAAPITSAFAAGDIDWNTTLVVLRLADNSVSGNTAVQLDNLVVAGGTPVTPVAPLYTAAPGADGNLLTSNPGFETGGTLNNYSGTYSFTGWAGSNYAFSQHNFATGTVGAGTVTEGTRKLVQRVGGEIVTAVGSRAAVTPGLTYEFKFDERVIRRTYPSEKLGTYRYLEFFDSAGVRLKQIWGTNSDYKVSYVETTDFPLNTWRTWTVRAVAPVGAASAGVRIENPTGQFVSSTQNYVDDRDVELDNIRLNLVPDSVDRVAVRRAPRLVEPGKTASLKLHSLTLAPRTLRASLVDAAGTVRANASVAVATGRFRAIPLDVAIPSSLPDGTYSWRFELLPSGGGAAVAALEQPGVLIDQSVATSTINTTDFRADHARIQWQGRIESSGNSRIWHWLGSEARLRFSGTSLTVVAAVVANIYNGYDAQSLTAVVDENFANPITVNFSASSSAQTVPVVSGLADGVHTVRLYKNNESNLRLRFDTFRVDAGKGLLACEPLPSRRLEVYGDSVTNASSPSYVFLGYSMLLGRELDTDFRNIAKGGTGIASSFSGQALISNFYNNFGFPDVFNANVGGKYDMTQWTPQIVLFGFGHNDQFNGGGGTPFNTKYGEIKASIRAAYPGVKIFSFNTLISAPLPHFQNATDPLTANDPDHRFAFQPFTWNDSNTAHPPTDGHAAMVYGDERRFSMAEIVEDMMGWGLDAPASGYETWAAANFTAEQRVAGLHAPAAAPFNDGVPNLLRYALGVAPGAPVTPPSVAVDDSGRLSLSFQRAQEDAIYVVETSNDLVTWNQAAINPGSAGGPVTWLDAAPMGPRRFARLRVVMP